MRACVLLLLTTRLLTVNGAGAELNSNESSSTADAARLGTSSETPLNSAQQAYGQGQVDQVIHDLPQLWSIIVPGNEIHRWLVRAFAAPDLNYQVAWSPRTLPLGYETEAVSSSVPDTNNVAYVEVEGFHEDSAPSGRRRSADEIMSDLIFELNNVRHIDRHGHLYLQAALHTIDRDTYIVESARAEYLAMPPTVAFYRTIWAPFCLLHDITPSARLWKAMTPDTFEKWLAMYPASSWYPWQVFGKRYDYIYSCNCQSNQSMAMAGNLKAEDAMGNLDEIGQDYAGAFAWYSKAALLNDIVAERELASLYRNGWGTKRDDQAAFFWSLKAAGQGDAESEGIVANCYQNGIGIVKDELTANEWQEKAKSTPK